MKTITMSLMTVLLLAASSLAGDRLENDFKAIFVKHWQISKEFTLAVAEAMPAELIQAKSARNEFRRNDVLARQIQLRRLCSCCRDGGDGRTCEQG